MSICQSRIFRKSHSVRMANDSVDMSIKVVAWWGIERSYRCGIGRKKRRALERTGELE